MLLRPRVEEQPARLALPQVLHGWRPNVRDGVLECLRRGVARSGPARVDAESALAEPVAQERCREQCSVREAVRLVRQRRQAAHRERERLVLLDQVEEVLVVPAGERLLGQVRRPPGRRHESIRAAHLDAGRLAAEHDLDTVEEAVQPAVGLHRSAPRRRQRPDGVHGQDAHAQSAVGQAARKVQLADVATEEVVEVDRRDEQVDPLRRVVAQREIERRELLVDHPQRGRLGSLAPRLERESRRWAGVEAQPPRWLTGAGGRANRAPPGEAEEEPELRAERLGPAEELARRACRQPAEREQRAVGAHEARQRAALLRLHPSPAAQLQDRCELEQPARVHEVGEPPQPDAVAQRPAPAAEPVAELRHPVRRGVSEHRLTVLDVVVERARDKRHVAERESGEAEPVVVEVVELPGRERKRVGEQLAPEQ